MKQSPAKGKLDDFFSSLGKQLQSNKRDIGGEMKEKYSSKAQREDRVPRPGESKYQFDVRTRGKRKDYKKRTSGIDPSNKTKMVDVVVDGVVKSIPAEDRFKYESVKRVKSTPKPKSKSTKPDWTKAPKVGTQARTDWYKKFNFALDETTPGYKSKKNKVKKKEINAKTIKQDIAPTPGPLDPKYMPKTGDKELTFEDFQRITKPRNENMGGLQSTYIGKPIIDPLVKQSMKLSGKGLNSLFEGEPEPEIKSGIRKKSPSKKRGYKMKRKK